MLVHYPAEFELDEKSLDRMRRRQLRSLQKHSVIIALQPRVRTRLFRTVILVEHSKDDARKRVVCISEMRRRHERGGNMMLECIAESAERTIRSEQQRLRPIIRSQLLHLRPETIQILQRRNSSCERKKELVRLPARAVSSWPTHAALAHGASRAFYKETRRYLQAKKRLNTRGRRRARGGSERDLCRTSPRALCRPTRASSERCMRTSRFGPNERILYTLP